MSTHGGADTGALVEYLSGIAALGRPVTYTECMHALAVADVSALVTALGEVQRMQEELACDLSALVVSRRTGRPGGGWGRGATEDWESAVARCYQTYSKREADMAASTGSDHKEPASIHGLPYDPGNAGDLLKHGWLAVAAQWLLASNPTVFRYADSFAGEWDYELLPPVAERAARLRDTPLAHYSRTAWSSGRYLGSTGVLGAIASHDRRSVEIWVGDRCRDRVARLVAEHGCRELPCSSDGYAVLKTDERYDLILLDPFAEFLDKAPELLPHIVARSASSSILLFVLTNSRASRAYRRYVDVLRDQCKTHTATAIVGGIPALAHPAVQGESGHDSEVVFIPRRELAHAAVDQLLPQLASSAVRTAAALGDAVEARLWITGP